MRTSKGGILAYKVFYRKVDSGESVVEYTCGHKGCALHKKVTSATPAKVVLKGAYTENTKLQKVGDKASLPDNLTVKLCERGWHAVTPGNLKDWITADNWRGGYKTVFLVRLSGDIKRGKGKIVARHIEMLEEIPYASKKGVALRLLAKKQQQAQAKRERAQEAAARLRRRAKEAKQRLARKARELHNRKVRRAVTELTRRENRVIRNLRSSFKNKRKALVKRLGGWR